MHEVLEHIRKAFAPVWAGLLDWSSRQNRHALAWGGLALAAVILLSVNLISTSLFRGVNSDLTEDRLFTISDGTRQILRSIDEPIDVNVYYSKKLGEASPTHARYFERVRALLEQYRDISGGKLQLTFLDPEPFSDAEDRAVASGLRGMRLNSEGEVGYFGLVASNATDNEDTIANFAPDRESFLEYDITKLVHALVNPKKRVVGLMTGLPIDGGMSAANMQMGQESKPTPPWLIMDQIREFFEVKKLDDGISEIPAGIDVLMVAQPTGLKPQSAYAIDQYALKGGKVLVFFDPMAETSQMAMMSQGQSVEGKAELNRVLKAWGINFDLSKAAADIRHARRVQFGGGRDAQGMVTEYIGWLTLDRESMDQNDVLSNGIDVLNLASPGFIAKADGATTELTPIIRTSSDAMEIDAGKLGMAADPVSLLRNYKPGGKPLTLAARITGETKSAFPNGKPTNEDKAGKEASKPADDKSKETPEDAAMREAALKGHVASGRINVILVADTDMLNDRFWVDRHEMTGQNSVAPIAHNAAFVVGALENLSGSDSLIALRARGVRERPFTLVEDLRRQSERQFREKEEGLTKKLQGIQQQLAKLQAAGDSGETVLTESERQAIEKFKGEMMDTRRELRSVKLALRHDIDRLDGWLKFANIALVPIALGLIGLVWSLWPSRRKSGS